MDWFCKTALREGGFPSISLGAEETEGSVDGMHLMVEAMQNKIFVTSWLHQPVEDGDVTGFIILQFTAHPRYFTSSRPELLDGKHSHGG